MKCPGIKCQQLYSILLHVSYLQEVMDLLFILHDSQAIGRIKQEELIAFLREKFE